MTSHFFPRPFGSFYHLMEVRYYRGPVSSYLSS